VSEYLSEKEQWELVKTWFRENGLWIVAGVIVGGGLLGGWRWWQDRLDRQGIDASAKYQEVVTAFTTDRSKGLVLLGEMERQYGASAYVDQAKLVAARIYVEAGDLDKAAAQLQEVLQRTKDSDLALVARLRLARVQIAQKKADDAVKTLSGVESGAFAARFHEIRGDAYHAKGDDVAALKEYRAARVGDVAGTVDTQLLDLKIADLPADAGATPKPTQPPAAAAAK
jgi:predicted negative regulator of RcsB-dependent stress response